MPEQDQIKVTTRQNEYLLLLKTGPKTTNDFMRSVMVSMSTAGKIVAKLRGKGLLTSVRQEGTRGNVQLHTLIAPYDELNLTITNNSTGIKITDEEVMYAAILRNGGLTGQRLTEQFKKVYPTRKKNTIMKHIVTKARREKLCR